MKSDLKQSKILVKNPDGTFTRKSLAEILVNKKKSPLTQSVTKNTTLVNKKVTPQPPRTTQSRKAALRFYHAQRASSTLSLLHADAGL